MIEAGHLKAFQKATERAHKAYQEGNSEALSIAARQMAAIGKIETYRRQVLSELNVPDLESDNENPVDMLNPQVVPTLSPREKHLADLITRSGKIDVQELSLQLNVRPKTIDTHLQNMTRIFGLKNRKNLIGKLSEES